MSTAIRLRPSQKRACKATYDALQQGHKRVITQMATGSGKTFTGSYFIKQMLEHIAKKTGKPANCLWVAHRSELLDQAQDAFAALDPNLKCTRWDADKKDATGSVTVAMIGSCRRLRGHFSFVVIDEAHHVAAEDEEENYSNQYNKLLKRINWDYLMGLTATPERLDERPLGFDHVAFTLTYLEQIKSHRLARPIWVEMRTNKDFQLQVRKGEFTNKSLTVLDEVDRNKKIVTEWMNNKDKYGKTLMFAVSVDHCWNLQKELRSLWADCPVEVITGATPDRERRRILEWFKDGGPTEQKIVINCEAFIEGLDVPTVKSVFLARPTMSKTFWMQMVGRGARIVTDRFHVPVTDIVSRTPAGDDGVEHFEFSNGSKYYGEDFGEIEPGVRDIEIHIDDEFYLVNIMDDITKYGSLVEEWEMELRDLTAEEITNFEDKRLLRQKRMAIQVLKDKKEIDPSDLAILTDARIVDVVGVLQISTYYQKRMSIPIDPDRYNCIRRLLQFTQKDCFTEQQGENGESFWHFDTEKYKEAYSHCVLKGEFPFSMFERIRVAFYFRFVQQREKVEFSGDHKFYETWKYIPLVELTPASREKYLEAEIREAEAAKKANEEFNQKFSEPTSQDTLWSDIVKKARELASGLEKPAIATRALNAILPRTAFTKVSNRRVTAICDEEVTNWRMMTTINKVGSLLTQAFQEYLDDPTALVRITPQSVNIDAHGESVESNKITAQAIGAGK